MTDAGSPPARSSALGWGIAFCLGASALALATAPVLMPESYSWVVHTTSESAAQGLNGAWLARLGFFLFGLAVLWLSVTIGRRWGRPGRLLHGLFGVLMLATAAFSHRPFEPGDFDRTEDLLHSVSATALGFAFAFGVLAVMMGRRGPAFRRGALDVVALAASILIPIGMTTLTDYAGLMQRTMFLIAYVWYAAEALTTSRRSGAPTLRSGEARRN